ncbi:MAG: LamB/YcsF family protein [Anaerolineales bacterium]|nr:LamB/YcsF family protein [Anaerolineales bacterium]
MDLNCDLGEGFDNDEAFLPCVTSINLACGAHAGDETTARMVLRCAKKFQVNVGAHPSWEDRENFGRKEVELGVEEAERIVFNQLAWLARIAAEESIQLTHVKPHGALYNQSAKDVELARAVARAVKRFDDHLILVGLAGSKLIEAGSEHQLRVAREGFPDRRYNADGSLLSRSVAGAVLESPAEVAAQAWRLIQSGGLDTLCLHGDHPNAVANAHLLKQALEANGVKIIGL